MNKFLDACDRLYDIGCVGMDPELLRRIKQMMMVLDVSLTTVDIEDAEHPFQRYALGSRRENKQRLYDDIIQGLSPTDTLYDIMCDWFNTRGSTLAPGHIDAVLDAYRIYYNVEILGAIPPA